MNREGVETMNILDTAPTGIYPLKRDGKFFDLYLTPNRPARHPWLVRIGAWCLNHAGFSIRFDGADFSIGIKA